MKKRVDYQLNNRREQLEQRRHLRSNGTPAEAAMWKLLKNKKIMGLQWRRQFSVGSYILDFYCFLFSKTAFCPYWLFCIHQIL